MNSKALKVLEYDKIIMQLESLCVSDTAKDKARTLVPLEDFAAINQALDETSEAESALLKHDISIGKIINIKPALKQASIGSVLNNKQLLDITDSLRSARNLKRYIKMVSSEGDFPVLVGLGEQITSNKSLEEKIESCIKSETQLFDNASSKLAQIRRAIENKQLEIRQRLDKMVQTPAMTKYLQDNVITIRDDRFVLPVKSEHKNHVKGIVHDQSGSGSTFYIEPMAIVNLNNELRELFLAEQKEIERILADLTVLVAEYSVELELTNKITEELDFIFAKGKLSIEMHATRAGINQERKIIIKKGKHPLLDPKTVVPINFELGGDYRSLLITGPNTGGKTVTLKTVGLFALMTQAGLHLPTEAGSSFPIFEEVFADIGDEQSIEQSLSTFSSHMTNIVDIVNNCSDKALVLFDELGAGTDPTEGAALAMAILSKVYEQNALTVATTHYSELKHFALSKAGFKNASVEFDVDTLSPTYKLIIGTIGKSNAFEISRKLGLTPEIINDAKNFLDDDALAFEDVVQAVESDKKRLENELKTAEQLKADAEILFERARVTAEKAKNQREKNLANAKIEANKIVKETKAEIDQLLKELRQFKANQKVDFKKLEELRQRAREKEKSLRTGIVAEEVTTGKVPKKVKIGQEVMVATLNQRASVLELPNSKGDVKVQVGIMKMNVNIKDLRLTEQRKKQKYQFQKVREVSAQVVRSEIDLRGQNLDEARFNLDKYLDDAAISGLSQVTVIHGIGTGVLKKGIPAFLKKHAHVKSMRAGVYGEGGAGVTIVTLK